VISDLLRRIENKSVIIKVEMQEILDSVPGFTLLMGIKVIQWNRLVLGSGELANDRFWDLRLSLPFPY
jgi:hypothetical protein